MYKKALFLIAVLVLSFGFTFTLFYDIWQAECGV